ncbi:MAG TPA: class I SAM-dependent methyltransferase [Candidatus Latescibacteria bacterium]|nr:class I SAM-dependent methyltransferase [Candidatus Latescibacterota bacterium]HQI75847.1 class I SAM-dependent methyltransferase [Candidatus Latescibacterota bacterium]HQK23869.1 class I SAM-dependent methyltransferase [Candidatus Latescibacterota bacterium]
MPAEFRSPDWDSYRMDMHDPHRELEPLEREVRIVDQALERLRAAGIIPHTRYDSDKMLAFRAQVAASFDIPWTAITPRQQRLIWAINAICQPKTMVAAGVFCGNTFISNAGAAVGAGAAYRAERLIGLEIKQDEAARAERNVRRIDPTGVAKCVAADAVDFVRDMTGEINLLYLDADGAGGRGKGVYLDILEAAWDKMPKGSIVLAHNSVNCAEKLSYYLAFVRDTANMEASMNVVIDGEGLEVSAK